MLLAEPVKGSHTVTENYYPKIQQILQLNSKINLLIPHFINRYGEKCMFSCNPKDIDIRVNVN